MMCLQVPRGVEGPCRDSQRVVAVLPVIHGSVRQKRHGAGESQLRREGRQLQGR